VDGKRLGRAQVDGPVDSVLGLVDRLSVTLLRDVWRSREPIPNLQIASLTTDSLEALRAYLQGEQFYRRLVFDSALAAYTRAVEVDSSFALANMRRALVFGWTGGYGSSASLAASAAGFRFADRLPPRDRRLLNGYRAFERGKPGAIDSLRAFVAEYPGDLEGWYLLGESLFHINDFAPASPDSTLAAFDRVLQGDSTLLPAAIHQLDLALMYRDRARFDRARRLYEASAPPGQRDALDVAAGIAWGPRPADTAFRRAMAGIVAYSPAHALGSVFRRPDATSDTVLQLYRWVHHAGPENRRFLTRSLTERAHALVGMGRLEEALPVVDSLIPLAEGDAARVLAAPVALGIAPASYGGSRLESIVGKLPPGALAHYARGSISLSRGKVKEGRREIDAGLALGDTVDASMRGLLVATRGWASLIEGDTVAGVRELRAGIEQAASPGQGGETAFVRFQLALALSARPETRTEGIRWLRFGFVSGPSHLVPLGYLALGRAWEAAGERDSAAYAYGRFVRLWDKADPPLQGRVREAREALARLSAEPRAR